jgi:hypothetical protein
MTTQIDDPWRLEEWRALPNVCFIAACDSLEVDERGPVFLRDGSIRKACIEHWEPIFRVLGEQASMGDAMRWTPEPAP